MGDLSSTLVDGQRIKLEEIDKAQLYSSHMPHTWSLYFNLKGEPHRVLAVSRDIAAYMYIVPNGKLGSGQQAKQLQCLKEAVARDDLRLSRAPRYNHFTSGVLIRSTGSR